MGKKTRRKITYTITDDATGAALTKKEFIKQLLWAIYVYSVGIFVLTAIVIVILFFIFRFNVLVPLLIAVPASILLGAVVLLITIVIDNRPSNKNTKKAEAKGGQDE